MRGRHLKAKRLLQQHGQQQGKQQLHQKLMQQQKQLGRLCSATAAAADAVAWGQHQEQQGRRCRSLVKLRWRGHLY
jgi:hypothetical protein